MNSVSYKKCGCVDERKNETLRKGDEMGKSVKVCGCVHTSEWNSNGKRVRERKKAKERETEREKERDVDFVTKYRLEMRKNISRVSGRWL